MNTDKALYVECRFKATIFVKFRFKETEKCGIIS